MRVRASTGDEWPGGSEVFQTAFLSGPNSTGRFVASETPVPLGPRKRGHSPSFAIARPTQNSAKMSAAMKRIGIIVLQCFLIFFAEVTRPSWTCSIFATWPLSFLMKMKRKRAGASFRKKATSEKDWLSAEETTQSSANKPRRTAIARPPVSEFLMDICCPEIKPRHSLSEG